MTRLLAVALLLPAVVTGVTLAGVAANRAGGREAIVLTERELYRWGPSEENTASRVWLAWQEPPHEAGPLPREKLAALGFDVSVDPSAPEAREHYARLLPKQMWAAFELAGPAFDALPPLAREKGSRLVVVDASSEAGVLAGRYPDGARYLVCAAIVRAIWMPPGKTAYVAGAIESVLPRELHVPRAFAPVLAGDHYRLSVKYGRRFEPWIVDASR